jgi:hypothetical protein
LKFESPKHLQQLLLKPQNTSNKPCLETDNVGDNVKKFARANIGQKFAIYLGWFIFTKIHNDFPNVAHL